MKKYSEFVRKKLKCFYRHKPAIVRLPQSVCKCQISIPKSTWMNFEIGGIFLRTNCMGVYCFRIIARRQYRISCLTIAAFFVFNFRRIQWRLFDLSVWTASCRKPKVDMAAKRRKKHKNKILELVISICYNQKKSKFWLFTNPSKVRVFKFYPEWLVITNLKHMIFWISGQANRCYSSNLS